MNKTDCFQLGTVKSAKGIEGEITIHIDADDPTRYKELDAMFIEVDGILTPFFVEAMNLRKSHLAIVRLEGLSSEAEARKLAGAEIYLPLSALPELEGNKFYYHEIIGFKAVDKNFGPIGEIKDVIDNKANPLFSIDHEGKEVLIPLADDTIEKVDRENQTMHLIAPEGLIDLYLEE